MKITIQKNWQLIVLTLVSLFTVIPLFSKGYFPHHDDLQIIRIYEMRKCFSDFQIPCRWVPDMGFGYGYPLFNYYSVFPYYLGGLISYFFSYINTAKILFILPQMFSGIGMYLFVKEWFGKNAGFISGVLYTYSPYKAVDTYVRGALSESFALGIIPFIFYFIFALAKKPSKFNILGLSVSFCLFLLTHNISTLLFTPIILVSIAYLYLISKRENFYQLLLSLFLGFGLATFFVLPAFFEKNLVQTETLTRFDLNYRGHFVNIKQLFFSNTWGFGASVPGDNDSLSFQIGWIHLMILISLIFLICLRKYIFKNITIKKRLDEDKKLITTFTFLFFGFSVFMTHYRSAFVWETFDILSYVQFPWRFLGLTAFFISILGGVFIYLIKENKRTFFALVIAAIVISFNITYFRPVHLYQVTDEEKLSGSRWITQQKGSILDYLPKTALEPKEQAPDLPIIPDDVQINEYESNSKFFRMVANSQEETEVVIPIFYFPEWKVKTNSEYTSPQYDNFGRIIVTLAEGENAIEGYFFNTPIRTFSNIISMVSLIGLIVYLNHEKIRKIFR